MATAGLLLLVMSGVAMTWPRVVAIPLSVVLGWVALSLFSRAATLHVEGRGLRWPWRGGSPPEPPTLSTSDARGDPAVADRLADAYVSHRHTTGTLPRPGGSRR